MKKKLFLITLVAALFVCLFAISVSAAEPDTTKESVTLGDETVCPLWDTDGNPLIWYVKATAEDGTKIYDYVDATSAAVDYNGGYSDSTGGVKWYQLSSVTVTVDGTSYSKSALVVLNLQSENVKITSGKNIGQHVNCLSKVFTGATNLEYVYLPLDTVDLNGENFKNCTALKYVNVAELTELREIGSQDFNLGNVKQFMAGQALDLSNTKITSIATNGFACCSATEIILPSTLTSVGSDAFKNCSSATRITFNSTLTSVNTSNLFSGCTNLETVTGMSNVFSQLTEIGSMFSGCTKINQVDGLIENGACVFPEGITKLGSYVLYKTPVKSIHIPSTVTSIGYQFAEESKVETLTFAENSQLTFIDHRAFMNCKSLSGTVILPDGLEEIDYGLFSGCTSLKAVKIPDTVTKYTENKSMFSGCTSLEYVQLSKNVSVIPDSMFENCSSLKAISIPEGVTSIGSKALRSCTSLKAIYLPSTLTTLGVSSTGNDKGAFYQSKNIYFVQNEFSVFNGDKLVENFVMPTKPEIYYMPSNLNFLGNSEFQNCNQMNSCIVFPVGVTSAAGCTQQGAFQGVGANSHITFVFLGDMQDLVIKQQDAGYANISFVFANANDKDLNSITLTIASAGTNKSQANSYMYFCNGNVTYDLSTFKAPSNTTYTVLETDFAKTVNTEETQPHFHNPRADKTSEATCELPAGSFTFCFCGALMTSNPVEGSEPLGHSKPSTGIVVYFPLVNGAPNYFEDAHNVYTCPRCNEEQDEVAEGTALFVGDRGYSYEEEGTSVLYRLHVNVENIKAYSSAFRYGIIVSGAPSTKPITLVDGAITYGAQTLVFEMQSANYEFDYIQAKVTNIGEAELNCQAYAIDNNVVTYIGHNNVNTLAEIVTYDAIVEAYGTTSGETKEN